ncbi:MAG TPA: hypothetical protein VKX17_01550 [Planctomycetota bacterium]|nr:hypothetical protein [Planctomycetota bacterium]
MNANTAELTQEQRKVLSNAYFRHMIAGILWCVGGAVLTAVTLALGKGTGLIFWGAIVFGIVDFFRGLFGWVRYML